MVTKLGVDKAENGPSKVDLFGTGCAAGTDSQDANRRALAAVEFKLLARAGACEETTSAQVFGRGSKTLESLHP